MTKKETKSTIKAISDLKTQSEKWWDEHRNVPDLEEKRDFVNRCFDLVLEYLNAPDDQEWNLSDYWSSHLEWDKEDGEISLHFYQEEPANLYFSIRFEDGEVQSRLSEGDQDFVGVETSLRAAEKMGEQLGAYMTGHRWLSYYEWPAPDEDDDDEEEKKEKPAKRKTL